MTKQHLLQIPYDLCISLNGSREGIKPFDINRVKKRLYK